MLKIAILLSILILGCSPARMAQLNSATLTSVCPKQANCTIELLPNKALLIESSSNGLRYSLVEQSGMNVIVYKYDKVVKGDIQDAGYREEIVFEYDGKPNASFVDSQLQYTKMLFGRFCYCKGQTGYYKVNSGRLAFDQVDGAVLELTVPEVPQIIQRLAFSLK